MPGSRHTQASALRHRLGKSSYRIIGSEEKPIVIPSASIEANKILVAVLLFSFESFRYFFECVQILLKFFFSLSKYYVIISFVIKKHNLINQFWLIVFCFSISNNFITFQVVNSNVI